MVRIVERYSIVSLQDVLGGERAKVEASTKYTLSIDDPHLTKEYFRQSAPQRTTLLSQTKPVLNKHYGSKDIARATQDTICVDNGLQYKYYDTTSHAYHYRQKPMCASRL